MASVANEQNERLRQEEERRNTISSLIIIRDRIVQEDRNKHIGEIAYIFTDIVGGVLTFAGIILAPFSNEGSFSLTMAGTACGAVSGSASVAHSSVKKIIVRNKCKEAIRVIEKYTPNSNVIGTLKGLLKEKRMLSRTDVFNPIIQVGKVVGIIWTISQDVKQFRNSAESGEADSQIFTSTPDSRENIKRGYTATTIILYGIDSIFQHIKYLSDRKMSECAVILTRIINKLQKENN